MATTTNTTLTPPRTGAVHGGWPAPAPARSPAVDGSWIAGTMATVVAIWACVALISVLSPDMVHGSEQQRMPVAAFGAWFWGFGASIAAGMAMARLRGDTTRRAPVSLAGATITIWVAAAVVSIFGPTLVTGSDPTTIPIAALIAPIVAALVTIGCHRGSGGAWTHGDTPAPLTARHETVAEDSAIAAGGEDRGVGRRPMTT